MMKRFPAPNTKKRTAPATNTQQKISKIKRPGTKVKAPPRSDPAYSLYSASSDSENDDAQKLNKDLDKCARLLTDMLDKEPAKLKSAHRPKKPSRSKSKSRTDRQDRRTEDKQKNSVAAGVRPLLKQTNRSPLAPTNDNIREHAPAFNHRLSTSTPETKNQRRSPQQYITEQNGPSPAFLHPNSGEPIRREKLIYALGGQNGYPAPHLSTNANFQQPTTAGHMTGNFGCIPMYHGYGPTSSTENPEHQPQFLLGEHAGRVRHRSSTFPVDTETFKNLAEKHFQERNMADTPRPASAGPTDSLGTRGQGQGHSFLPRDDYFLITKSPYQSPDQRRVQFEFEQPVRDTEGQVPHTNSHNMNGNIPVCASAPFVSPGGAHAAPGMNIDIKEHPNLLSTPADYNPQMCKPGRVEPHQNNSQEDESLQDGSHQDVAMSDLRSESTLAGGDATLGETPAGQLTGGVKQWDPLEVRSRYASIRYLVGELRALAGGDAEFKRIVTELETSINNVSPVKGAINLQAEIDLALQPLRSENCQLRRRLRILNQQLKERERKEKENIKPDTSFEFAHLHAKYSSVQQKFNEEREKNSQLQNRIYQLEGDIETVKTEKQKMMLTLSEKDTDHMKTRHDWLQETTKLKKDLDACNKKIDELKIKLEASDRERQASAFALQQRDTEVNRMTDLVHEYKIRYDPSRPQPPLSNRSSPAGQGASRLTRQALEEFNKTNQPAEKIGSPGLGLADMEVRETYAQRSPKMTEEPEKDGPSPFRPARFESRPSPQGFEGSGEEKSRSPGYGQVNVKSKTVSFVNQQDDESTIVSSVSEKVSRRPVTPPLAVPKIPEVVTCTPLIPEPATPRSDTSAYSRYSVTDYFNKYPQGQFRQYTASFHLESTRQGTDMDSSMMSSLSSFDDGKSIGSESILTSSSVSSINSQDDRTFREGLANLDANIARLQNALKKTTVR